MISIAIWTALSNASSIVTLLEGGKDLKDAFSKPVVWREELGRIQPRIDFSRLSAEDGTRCETLDQYFQKKFKERSGMGAMVSPQDRENFLKEFYHAHPQYRGDRDVESSLLGWLDSLNAFLVNSLTLGESIIIQQYKEFSEKIQGVDNRVADVQRKIDMRIPSPPSWEDLERALKNAFVQERETSPATEQMEISDALFPRPQFDPLSAPILEEGDPEARPLIGFLRKSWSCRKHISLSGIGGIGKSVSLLTLPWECPMIYVPLRDLQDDISKPVSQYIQDNVTNDQALTSTLQRYIREPWEYGEPPGLLLILDGLNELSQEMRNTVLKEVQTVWLKRMGVQLLISSRYDVSNDFFSQRFLRLYLERLTSDQISAYLEGQGLPRPDPADRIMHVIDTPLMLILYAEGTLTRERYRHEWAVWREPQNAGAIIWNYLCSELCRVQMNDQEKCYLATQWITPHIAWQMMRKGQFKLPVSRFSGYIKEALNLYQHLSDEEGLSEDFAEINLAGLSPEVFNVSSLSRFLTIQTHLFKGQDHQYSLTHQHFRDCLAAIYLLHIAESFAREQNPAQDLPQAWREPFTMEVMAFLSDLLKTEKDPRKTWGNMWAFARREQAKEKAAGQDGGVFIRKLLELYRMVFDKDLSAVDFSGLDLSSVSLSGSRLHGKNHFQGTVLSRTTFFGSGHQMKTCSVSWSPSGKQFLSASHDCTIRIWSGERSVLLQDPAVHSRYIRCAQWSPQQENLIASAGDDLNVVLWRCTDQDRQWVPRIIGRCEDWVCSLAWSPDGRWIVCGDRSGHVTLFSAEADTPPRVFSSPHRSHVCCAAWTREGPLRFATGSDDGVFCVWDPEQAAPLWQGAVPDTLADGRAAPCNLLSLEWIRDEHTLLAATERQIFLCRENGPLQELLCLEKHLSYAAVSPRKDGDYLALFYKKSEDGRFFMEIYRCVEEDGCYRPILWAAKETSSQEIFQISCAAWRGDHLACGTQDGDICRIELSFENNDEERIFLTRMGNKCPNSIRCSGWSYDGRYLAAGGDDQRIRVWDTENWQCVLVLAGHDDSVKCLTWSPHDYRLFSGSDDRTVRVWNLETGEFHVGRGHTGPVNCVYWTRSDLLISGSDDCTLRRWSPDAEPLGAAMEGHEKRVYGVAASPDEKILASGGNDRKLRLWDAAAGKPAGPVQVDSEHWEPIRGLVWSRDNVLFSVSNDNRLLARRWEAISDPPLVFPEAHTDFIYSVALSPDERTVITGSTDTDVGFFDIQTLRLLTKGEDHDGFIWNVSAQASGGHLAASTGSDGTVRVWDVSHLPPGKIHPIKCLEIIPCMDLTGCDFSGAEMDERLRQLLNSNGGVMQGMKETEPS